MALTVFSERIDFLFEKFKKYRYIYIFVVLLAPTFSNPITTWSLRKDVTGITREKGSPTYYLFENLMLIARSNFN